MTDSIDQTRIARLEAAVANHPGAPEFPALAEALRRAGRLRRAEEVARSGLEREPGCVDGTVALALALLEQGRIEDARWELVSRAAEYLATREPSGMPRPHTPNEFPDDVTDGEIERAFDDAEPVRDQLVDADRVALEAMRAVELDRPEEGHSTGDPLFATQTMADLLERQGDTQAASRIRATLSTAGPRAEPARVRGQRERIIETLEGWLITLRREPR
ncbi:MAG: hypothetical protein ACE5FL_04430 [Myxococcota bacterium]